MSFSSIYLEAFTNLKPSYTSNTLTIRQSFIIFFPINIWKAFTFSKFLHYPKIPSHPIHTFYPTSTFYPVTLYYPTNILYSKFTLYPFTLNILKNVCCRIATLHHKHTYYHKDTYNPIITYHSLFLYISQNLLLS